MWSFGQRRVVASAPPLTRASRAPQRIHRSAAPSARPTARRWPAARRPSGSRRGAGRVPFDRDPRPIGRLPGVGSSWSCGRSSAPPRRRRHAGRRRPFPALSRRPDLLEHPAAGSAVERSERKRSPSARPPIWRSEVAGSAGTGSGRYDRGRPTWGAVRGRTSCGARNSKVHDADSERRAAVSTSGQTGLPRRTEWIAASYSAN